MAAAISAANVGKTFLLPHERRNTLKEYVMHPLRRTTFERNRALDDVSFEIERGEFFGLIGRNGSGKSTLLRVLAGIYPPDEGRVSVEGILSPFIELGVGFNYELNARDNILINGTLLGLSRRDLEAKFDEILAFAELERFVDQKLKNYSSGMLLRLAYSIAIQVPFDILLLDEVLAVGDENFQKKCFATFETFREQRKTIVFVSHDLSSVAQYCDRAILLEGGKLTASGPPSEVIEVYRRSENRQALGSRNGAGIRRAQHPTRAAVAVGSGPPSAVLKPVDADTDISVAPAAEPAARRVNPAVEQFHAAYYLRDNQRRLEHLASLGFDIVGKSVLEVGAGIGDHTGFFLDRDCLVRATDLREENVQMIRVRFPNVQVGVIDLDAPDPELDLDAEIVFCYGMFHHLAHPAEALTFLADCCSSLLLLEAAVSPGDAAELYFVEEEIGPAVGASGIGNRPTRPWVRERLAEHFPYVYLPLTQPSHPEFPLDWEAKLPHGIGRTIFLASREPLDNPLLTSDLPPRQLRA